MHAINQIILIMGCMDCICKVAIYAVGGGGLYFYLVLSVILDPIYSHSQYCQANSIVPQNATINLTMRNWIYGGIGSGVSIIVVNLFVFCLSVKYKWDENFQKLVIVVTKFLQMLFIFIWSIIGMVIYNDYNGKACQNEEDQYFLKLCIYYGLAFSSYVILIIIVLSINLCLDCDRQRQQARPLLENPPEVPVAPAQVAREAPVALFDSNDIFEVNQCSYTQDSIITPQPQREDQREEEVKIADAQFQRSRFIQERSVNRLSRNNRPRSQRSG